MPVRRTSFFDKINLTVKKDTQVLCHNRWLVLAAILMPGLISMILVYMRFSVVLHNVEYAEFDDITPEVEWIRAIDAIMENHAKLAKRELQMNNCFLPKPIVAYAPDRNLYRQLMTLASSKYLNNITLQSFESVEEMRNEMAKQHYFAGVSFENIQAIHPDHLMSQRLFKQYELSLDFSLVFPSELRFFNESFIGQSWQTLAKHNHFFITSGEKDHFDVYIREGFISLQHAVSMAFIDNAVGDTDTTQFVLKRFPRTNHQFDTIVNALEFNLPLVILIGYFYPCMHLAKHIVREKEQNLVRYMNSLGIGGTVNFLSWFIIGSLIFFVGSIPVLFILKIPWYQGFSILQFSSWSTVYVFLLCYNIASVTFCYLVTSPLSLTVTSVVMLTFMWFLTFLPFAAALTLEEEATPTISSFLLFNTAMGIGFQEILTYEADGEGLQWKNMFEKSNPFSCWSVGSQCCILIFMSIIYAIIGINMNGLTQFLGFVKRKVSSMCCHSTRPTEMRPVRYTLKRRKSKFYAVENDTKKPTIELWHLTYLFNRTPIVYDITMSFYEGEITVIMGHNGAGKTTLLLMIADFLKPTSGERLFHGIDLEKNFSFLLSMGLCFEHINFPQLTVANNINLYCLLKGLTNSDAEIEVKKYLTAMNLNNFSNILACNLSHGLKQSLSICCALCGGSKYVILDEPSAAMDSVARKRLWQLLMREKDHRVILISTNSTEEAEVLADRLAILSGGLLMCFGTQYFLKTLFGRGYRLVCIKSSNCKSEVVTTFIKNQIPDVILESEIGTELSYRFSAGYAVVLPKLLSDLEDSFFELNINSCSISEPSVEDIFLRMGAEDPSEDNRSRINEIMSGLTIYSTEYEKLSKISNYASYKGFKKTISHICAIFWKRFTHSTRRMTTILQFAMPAIFTIVTNILGESRTIRHPLKPKIFTMTHYPESITPLSHGEGYENSTLVHSEVQAHRFNLFRHYYETLPFLSLKHKVEFLLGQSFHDYALEKQEKMGLFFNKKYIVATTYGEGVNDEYKVTAWFNNYYLHSAPLSLNLAHNALLASRSYNGRITVTNDPLPFVIFRDPYDAYVNSYAGNYLPISLTLAILIVYASVMLFIINERFSRFKLLQNIYGANNLHFWLGMALYDIFRIVIISLITFLALIPFEYQTWEHILAAISVFFLMVFFGFCMIPFHYIISRFFQDNSSGYIFFVTYNIYGVVFFCAVVESTAQKNMDPIDLSFGYEALSYLVPYYSLSSCFSKIFSIEGLKGVCSIEEIKNISRLVDNCKTKPRCCVEQQRFNWGHSLGIMPEITFIFLIWSLCTLLLIAYCYRKSIARLFRIVIPTDNEKLAFKDFQIRHSSSATLFKDVISEAYRVERLKKGQYREKPLVMSNVSKVYGNRVTVHRCSLLLERCECFALLGANGAGKTRIVKMLVGDETLTSGRVHVDGISLTNDIMLMYKRIGYCPHTMPLPSYMTCLELLRFFCRLRGIKMQYIGDLSDCLLKVFGIVRYRNESLQHVSRGIKRRLGTAIALIGNPSIVYLDGLLINIDPAARRQLWNVICRICAQGKTVLFTSHDVFDCQRFCTRFGIIHNARLIYMDSINSINERFMESYVLQVKIKLPPKAIKSNSYASIDLQPSSSFQVSNPFIKIMTFVENEFPTSTVREHNGAIVIFLIPMGVASLSVIYKKIQRNAFFLNVQNFCITRETLPLIFNDLIEKGSKAPSTSSVISVGNESWL